MDTDELPIVLSDPTAAANEQQQHIDESKGQVEEIQESSCHDSGIDMRESSCHAATTAVLPVQNKKVSYHIR